MTERTAIRLLFLLATVLSYVIPACGGVALGFSFATGSAIAAFVAGVLLGDVFKRRAAEFLGSRLRGLVDYHYAASAPTSPPASAPTSPPASAPPPSPPPFAPSRWDAWLKVTGAQLRICAERGWKPGLDLAEIRDLRAAVAEIGFERAEHAAFGPPLELEPPLDALEEVARGFFRTMVAIGESYS